MLNPNDKPAPAALLEEAQKERKKIDLTEYRDTIVVLREKNWTLRQIAEWLNGKGIEADHNAVNRALKV